MSSISKINILNDFKPILTSVIIILFSILASFILIIIFANLTTLFKEKESLSDLIYRQRVYIHRHFKNITIEYAPSLYPDRSGKQDVKVTYYKPGERRIMIVFPKEEESPEKLKNAVNLIKNKATNFP